MIVTKTNIFNYLFLLISFEFILDAYTIFYIPTIVWWSLNILLFIVLFLKIKNRDYIEETNLLVVKLFIFWNIISIFRGFFYAETYLHWKALIENSYVFLMPFFVFLFVNESLLKNIISKWFKYMPFLVFLFIPFLTLNDFVGRFLAPFMLFLLIFPLLNTKWKMLTIFFLIVILTIGGLEARSTVIKFSVATLLGIIFYFNFLFNLKAFFKITHATFILGPIIVFILGVNGMFNIFQINSYLKGNYSTQKESLTTDTRTFIYKEVIESAIKHDYILIGRTPSRGYDSPFFEWYFKWEIGTGNSERPASEVSILNFFTWNGIIGVFFYFLVFLYSSYLAIYRSNNGFIKIIGLFVAFRWAYAFVEDFTKFDIQYLFLWIFISMCLSSSFRRMTNDEFKLWVRELLDNTKLIKFRN